MTIVSVGQGGPLEDRFRSLGLPVYVLPKRWQCDFTIPAKLAAIMRQKKANLVMSTLFYADIMSAAATILYKPKALVSWEVITGQLHPHQILLYKMFARRFDMVAAVSNSIHPFIISGRGQAADKIKTIYYGVDLEKYAPAQSRADKQEFVFGTVARLVYQKGHEYLLEAIPQVLKKFPKTRWQFAGTGPLETELRGKARELRVEHAVEFLGNRSDVPEVLKNFDAFVLPSLWEGFPNVILEAMARQKPIIATTVEGTVELVVDGVTGRLVPKCDANALAAAMLEFLNSPQLIDLYGQNGRQRVEQHFSLRKQVEEFEALYDALLN